MKQLKKLNWFLSLVAKTNAPHIVYLWVNALCSAGQVLANVILPKLLIDELLGAKRIPQLVLYVGLIAGFNLFFAFMLRFCKRGLTINREKTSKLMLVVLSRKIMRVDYSHLEDPHILDVKERARFAMENFMSVEQLINAFANAARYAITVIGLVAVLISLSWVVVLVLCATVAIMLLIQAQFAKYQVKFFAELIPVNRKYGYHVMLSFNPDGQKDYRLYGMNKMIANRIYDYNYQVYEWFSKFYHKMATMTSLQNVISTLQVAMTYCYVGIRCVSDVIGGVITIGDLTMYVNAAINFGTSVYALGESIVTIEQMLSYLDPFCELMSLPDEDTNCGNKLMSDTIDEIRFEHVTFTYPKCDKPVLSDITFTVKKGEKISIVGLNGAGKTTLVKLICRLYKPDSGNIIVNGNNIYDYDYESYIGQIAAVFQDFHLFAFAIDENVTCKPITDEKTEATAAEMLDRVGLSGKIAELENGIKTRLGKSYDEDGIELSGGQQQKIAIARALYKDAALVILDEPTSALDPISEAEIYENFNSMVGDKTAMYISHRMSSSKFCDRILVIDSGKVADYDTHEHLMEKDCLYAKLFNTQAKNYQL